MKVIVGADHAGFALKEKIKAQLIKEGYDVVDVGAHEYVATDDYPDSAEALATAVVGTENARGVLFCGSGVGATVAANKVKGARACLCHDIYSAAQGVEHDDMNILTLGGVIVGPALAIKLVRGFLGASFHSHHARFVRRRDKVLALENKLFEL